MDNYFLMALLAWPAVVVACGALNMLLTWTFSWSELIFDYLVGVAVGVCFVAGTAPDAGALAGFFLIMGHGLFGFLHVLDVDAFAEPGAVFAWSAGYLGAGLIAAAGLDRLTLVIGRSMNVGGGLLSIPIFALKAPFSLITSAIGFLFCLVGAIYGAATKKGRIGFLGGVVYCEWSKASLSTYATTLGCTVQTWKGKMSAVIGHELYHSRQYMYMRDWLVPAWLLGGLWGLASSAAAGSFDISYFSRANKTREIGNPIERAAYRYE